MTDFALATASRFVRILRFSSEICFAELIHGMFARRSYSNANNVYPHISHNSQFVALITNNTQKKRTEATKTIPMLVPSIQVRLFSDVTPE